MTGFSEYINVLQILWPSLVAAAGMGVAAGVIGNFVLLRKDSLIAITLPNMVALGAAIALRLGLPTLPVSLISVVLAVMMLASSKRSGTNHLLLASIYIAALCLSFLVIAGSGQHVAEMQSMFTGVDVAVTPFGAWMNLALMSLAAIICAIFWRRWLVMAQAPTTAEVNGLKPYRWELGFLLLLSVILLLGTNTLGVVMVIALLFLPAATVLTWARNIPQAMICTVLVSLLLVVAGFILSVECDWPFSQSVGGAGFVFMLISQGILHLKK